MTTHILIIVATAVLTSLLTVALAGWILRRRLLPRLESGVEEKLHAALKEVEEDLGQVIRERVRQGVLDAVAELPAPNLIREARRSVVRTASDLVDGGLSSLLGDRPRRDEP